MIHREIHRAQHVGWLRASVLGANDGLLSTASLVMGIAAANPGDTRIILITGLAGLVAGALSMAAGEYVSVSSQADTESADLAKERWELAHVPERELEELKQIYMGRGLDEPLALQVAEQLTAHNALEAHARDELGITELSSANPVQAALASAAAFAVGAAMPLLLVWLAPHGTVLWTVGAGTVLMLIGLGVTSAQLGGAPLGRAVLRIVFWGLLAMGITALVGSLFGVQTA